MLAALAIPVEVIDQRIGIVLRHRSVVLLHRDMRASAMIMGLRI